jgi:hypothetical protein
MNFIVKTMLIIHLVKIRLLQAFREIRDMGMFRGVFLIIGILPLLALFLYRRLSVQGYDYAIIGGVLLLIFIIHRSRKDYYFLSKLSNPPVWIFFVEYLVFSLPLLVLLLIFGHYVQLFMYIALLSAICFVKPLPKGAKTKTFNAWVKHIPTAMFEWRSGVRVSLPAIIILYGLGLAGIFSIWFSVVSLVFLSLIFSAFYGTNEAKKILIASEQSADVLLRCKLVQHVKYWALFLLPLILLAFIHYQYWAFILAAFAASVNLLIFAIHTKYAYYRPASTGMLSQLIVALAWLCSVILPLSVFVFLTNIVFILRRKII